MNPSAQNQTAQQVHFFKSEPTAVSDYEEEHSYSSKSTFSSSSKRRKRNHHVSFHPFIHYIPEETIDVHVWHDEEIWYNRNELKAIRADVKGICYKIMREISQQRQQVAAAESSSGSNNNNEAQNVIATRFLNSLDSTMTIRGLEYYICSIRKRRKEMVTKFILNSQTGLRDDVDGEKLASIARRITARSKKIAQEEGAATTNDDHRSTFYNNTQFLERKRAFVDSDDVDAECTRNIRPRLSCQTTMAA